MKEESECHLNSSPSSPRPFSLSMVQWWCEYSSTIIHLLLIMVQDQQRSPCTWEDERGWENEIQLFHIFSILQTIMIASSFSWPPEREDEGWVAFPWHIIIESDKTQFSWLNDQTLAISSSSSHLWYFLLRQSISREGKRKSLVSIGIGGLLADWVAGWLVRCWWWCWLIKIFAGQSELGLDARPN